MPKKTVKMILDLVMTVLIVLLMDLSTTGLALHEILGLLAGALFVVHKVLNWAWVRSVTKNLFKKAIKPKTRVMYFLNLLVFVSVSVMIVSGILISESLFHFTLSSGTRPWLVTLHRSAAYSSLVLVSVHLGLHWASVVQAVKRLFGLSGFRRARTIAARLVAVCIMLAGIKASADRNLVGEIAAPLTKKSGTGEGQQALRSYRKHDGATLAAASVSTQAAASETLEEYLSGLVCTACSRHCPLSSPRCGRGELQATQAETEYYSQNGGSTESTEQSGSTGGTAPSAAFLEWIPIMGLFVGGTHYTVLLTKKKTREPAVPRLPE